MRLHSRPAARDERDTKFFQMIDGHGWAVTMVGLTEKDPDDSTTFAYTTGIYEKFDAPEAIMFGLDINLMAQCCNEYGRLIETGLDPERDTRHADFLGGHFIELRKISSQIEHVRHTYMMATDWYYNREGFPAVQIVWPTSDGGLFPWNAGYPSDLDYIQPLMFDGAGKH